MPDPGFLYVFLFVLLVTIAMGIVVSRMARGITFCGIGTDNQIQVQAAARAGNWRWPSDMHSCGSGKTRMKDVFVICLAAVQRLLRDRETDYSTVVLCIVANGLSAIAAFLLATGYWNLETGVLVFLLFVTSFWPYQVALFGGHICLAQLFFLASALAFFIADRTPPPSELWWYGASGLTTGLMMFSSASARKFLPLVAGAFFYSQREYFAPSWANLNGATMFQGVGSLVVLAAVSLVGVGGVLAFTYKRVVTAAYFGRGPRWLNGVMKARSQLGLENYLNRARAVVRLLGGLCLAFVLYLLGSLLVFRAAEFYSSQVAFCLGFFLVLIILTYPNALQNILGYFSYWDAPKDRGHFKLYREYFAKIGKPIGEDMRGAGTGWVIRFFWRIAPFHFSFYLVSMAVAVSAIFARPELAASWSAVGIILLSLSPVLVGEITRGPQLGRTYFPAFIGMLLLTGYAVFQLGHVLGGAARVMFWLVIGSALLASALWNMHVFVRDIWPARMASAWLGRTLLELRIKKFYTYDTPYNDSFVKSLPRELLQNLEIVPIKTLNDVEEGYVVIPGISAKALNMESSRQAIDGGDFGEDPVLNRIIESREISRCALASFKTFGTSRIWVHESDVASYRDLVLGEIGGEDRWRGHAWIIDVGKLRECLSPQ